MNNHQPSEIVPNSPEESPAIAPDKSAETILESRSVSVNSYQNPNSFRPAQWTVLCIAVVLVFASFFLLAKGNEFCFLSTCNQYSDSVSTDSQSIGNDFKAYAGGAATLLVLTTIAGVPLLPAVAASAAVWFLMQIIH